MPENSEFISSASKLNGFYEMKMSQQMLWSSLRPPDCTGNEAPIAPISALVTFDVPAVDLRFVDQLHFDNELEH